MTPLCRGAVCLFSSATARLGFGLHDHGCDSSSAAFHHPSAMWLFLSCCLPAARVPHSRVCSDYFEPMAIPSLPTLPSFTLRHFSLDKLRLMRKSHVTPASISAASPYSQDLFQESHCTTQPEWKSHLESLRNLSWPSYCPRPQGLMLHLRPTEGIIQKELSKDSPPYLPRWESNPQNQLSLYPIYYSYVCSGPASLQVPKAVCVLYPLVTMSILSVQVPLSIWGGEDG